MPMNPRLLVPRATGFSPRSIAGLVGWWDASDSSTVTLNGSRVSSLANKVSGGPAQTQAAAANQPLYVTGAQNGKNILRYDDTGRWLAHATNQDVGFYAIAMAPTGTTSYGGLFSFTDRYGILRNGTSDNVFFDANSAFALASYRRNGVATSVLGTTWGVFTQGGTPVTKAAQLVADTSGRRGTGDIGEFVVYNRDLTTAERQKVEGWLAWRWGLQSQLPYDHPYAKSFPGFGSQATPTDADTLTYLAAVAAADGTGVEVGVANAVESFITGCKEDGIWDAIKASCILAGARTLAGALVPLRGSAPTNNNFAEVDYNRETGLVGDGSTTYLDSNRNNNADPQDDKHLAAYVSSVAADGITIGSGAAASTGRSALVKFAADNIYRINTSTSVSDSNAAVTGFFGATRSDGANVITRSDGGSTTRASASQAPLNENIGIFARVDASAHCSERIAFYSIGESLDLAALDTRVTALITAIGAAI